MAKLVVPAKEEKRAFSPHPSVLPAGMSEVVHICAETGERSIIRVSSNGLNSCGNCGARWTRSK